MSPRDRDPYDYDYESHLCTIMNTIISKAKDWSPFAVHVPSWTKLCLIKRRLLFKSL